MKKHPTLGKRALAEMYFLRPNPYIEPKSITEDSPILVNTGDEKYLKIKNYKWNFYGLTKNKARFSKSKEIRTAFLLNPLQSSPIIASIKHLIPEKLKTVHAYDDPVKVEQVIRFKLNLALTSSSKTPTLKEKLFKIQKGNCYLCDKMIDPEYIHFNSVHIHHIVPIKSKGNKFALKNLALTHI